MVNKAWSSGWTAQSLSTDVGALHLIPIYSVLLNGIAQFQTSPTRTVEITKLIAVLNRELPDGQKRKHYVKKVKEAA